MFLELPIECRIHMGFQIFFRVVPQKYFRVLCLENGLRGSNGHL